MKDYLLAFLRGPLPALLIGAAVIVGARVADQPKSPTAAGQPPPMLAPAPEAAGKARDRLAYRLAVHEALHQIAAEQPEHAAHIRTLLGHRRAESRLQLDVETLVQQQAADIYGGPLTDFLQWLMDHSDQILKLVQAILQMFHLAALDAGPPWALTATAA